MVRFNLRSLFLVFGVVILLIVSVGCNHTNDNIPDDTKDTQSSEVPPVTPVTTSKTQQVMVTRPNGNLLERNIAIINAVIASTIYICIRDTPFSFIIFQS